MSRASELRDAIRDELENQLDDQTVDRCVLPRYKPEELEAGPRVVVRIGSRESSLNQGPDEISIVIQVGVVGIDPDHSESAEGVTFTDALISKVDEYDALLEQVMLLWLNRGPMSEPICHHTPRHISPGVDIDYDRLEREGIYLSFFQVTYRDSRE